MKQEKNISSAVKHDGTLVRESNSQFHSII